MKDILKEEHNGFAMTLEVICTLAMMFMFLNFILYYTRVLNVQRYMNTILTSTATMAARWGGVNTAAYRANVNPNQTLLQVATEQLRIVAPDYNARITGSPEKITKNGQEIYIKIEYSLPSIFSEMSKVNSPNKSYDMYQGTRNMSMDVRVVSIMEAGKLL